MAGKNRAEHCFHLLYFLDGMPDQRREKFSAAGAVVQECVELFHTHRDHSLGRILDQHYLAFRSGRFDDKLSQIRVAVGVRPRQVKDLALGVIGQIE